MYFKQIFWAQNLRGNDPQGFGSGSPYKKRWKPLVCRTNFQGSHGLWQRQSKKSASESKNAAKQIYLRQ